MISHIQTSESGSSVRAMNNRLLERVDDSPPSPLSDEDAAMMGGAGDGDGDGDDDDLVSLAVQQGSAVNAAASSLLADR